MQRIARLMTITGLLTAAFIGTGCGVPMAAQSSPMRLETILRQLDEASARFQSAQADLKQELFTKVVNDTQEQHGMIYFLRKNTATQMGVKFLQPAQVIEYKDGKLRMFTPGINHIDEYATSGKNQAMAQTFLTLGFGGSGKDLERQWTITDKGAEQINDAGKSISVEELDLVPKEESLRKNFTHITIWVDPVRGVSLKQVLYSPSGDTRTAYYSNIRLNQKVDVGPFAIKCKGACS